MLIFTVKLKAPPERMDNLEIPGTQITNLD